VVLVVLVLALAQAVKNSGREIQYLQMLLHLNGIKVVYNVYIYTLYINYSCIGILFYNGCAGFGQQFW
jgi:hypothetical protein